MDDIIKYANIKCDGKCDPFYANGTKIQPAKKNCFGPICYLFNTFKFIVES